LSWANHSARKLDGRYLEKMASTICGPVYRLIQSSLQGLLIGWSWHFTVRRGILSIRYAEIGSGVRNRSNLLRFLPRDHSNGSALLPGSKHEGPRTNDTGALVGANGEDFQSEVLPALRTSNFSQVKEPKKSQGSQDVRPARLLNPLERDLPEERATIVEFDAWLPREVAVARALAIALVGSNYRC
jgi:hypothetical protein